MLSSLLHTKFSAKSVKSSQLWDIWMAVWTSRSWFTSRLLVISAHSSCRSCDTRGVKRGPLQLLAAPADNGLKLAECRRARIVNIEGTVSRPLEFGVGVVDWDWVDDDISTFIFERLFCCGSDLLIILGTLAHRFKEFSKSESIICVLKPSQFNSQLN